MAKILYGIAGLGIGHSTRSQVIIDYLLKQGHEIKVITSNEAYNFLTSYYNQKKIEVIKIFGLELSLDHDKINILKTIYQNLNHKSFIKGNKTLARLLLLFNRFKPDLLITDFEPFTSLIANLTNTPFISITNMHIMKFFNIEFLYAWKRQYFYTKTVVNNHYRLAKKYFITTFFYPPLKSKKKRKKAILIGPILRSEILKAKPTIKDYTLVYLREPEKAIALLQQLPQKFIIYSLKPQKNLKNMIFKTIQNTKEKNEYFKDIASAKAVISHGGFSLMTEAFYLKKPVFAIPYSVHFEQMLNSYYLNKLNYGAYALKPKVKNLERFFANLEFYRKNLNLDQNKLIGNDQIFKHLDKLLKKY